MNSEYCFLAVPSFRKFRLDCYRFSISDSCVGGLSGISESIGGSAWGLFGFRDLGHVEKTPKIQFEASCLAISGESEIRIRQIPISRNKTPRSCMSELGTRIVVLGTSHFPQRHLCLWILPGARSPDICLAVWGGAGNVLSRHSRLFLCEFVRASLSSFAGEACRFVHFKCWWLDIQDSNMCLKCGARHSTCAADQHSLPLALESRARLCVANGG